MILAIDPSSTMTGYAVLDGTGKLIERGRLTPKRTRDPVDARIDAMLAELVGIRDEHPLIADVVIEDTTGKVGARHRGGGAGLAQYGKSIRAFRDQCRRLWPPERVHMVLENVWTRGKPKRARAAALGLLSDADPGLDSADAVGLGMYWLASGDK